MSLIALDAPVCRVCDFWLIFVPFGRYDETEILPYAIRLICSIGADVRQLCGLSLKMEAWEREVGWESTSPMQRATFITTHMRSGMNRIKEIEDSAPAISDL